MSTLAERLAAKAIDAPALTAEKPHATCRAPYNHDWDEFESQTNPEGGGWYLTMRCTKCGTIFRQIINPDGSLNSGRSYNYPKDYKDPNKWSRSQWRLNYLNRLNGRR